MSNGMDNTGGYGGEFMPTKISTSDLDIIVSSGRTHCAAVRGLPLMILPVTTQVHALYNVINMQELRTAQAAIVIAAAINDKEDTRQVREVVLGTANRMVVAAGDVGLATLWIDAQYLQELQQEAALKALNIPPNYKLWVLLAIGKPKRIAPLSAINRTQSILNQIYDK